MLGSLALLAQALAATQLVPLAIQLARALEANLLAACLAMVANRTAAATRVAEPVVRQVGPPMVRPMLTSASGQRTRTISIAMASAVVPTPCAQRVALLQLMAT